MLVVQKDSLDTLLETDDADHSTNSGLLGVQSKVRYRRKSSGNIARDLDTTLYLLEPSQRRSSESAR
jgi:hypothetical protein